MTRSICKRCHRLHDVNRAGYCEDCDEHLREDEKPKRRPASSSVEQQRTDDNPAPQAQTEAPIEQAQQARPLDHRVGGSLYPRSGKRTL